MGTLTNSEIGSIVYNLITGIPVGISGLLPTLVNQQIYFAEQVTGYDISPSAIEEKYQPAILDLTCANVLSLMESQGLGTKSVQIGELSLTKGMVEGTSLFYKNLGMEKLNSLGTTISYYKAND